MTISSYSLSNAVLTIIAQLGAKHPTQLQKEKRNLSPDLIGCDAVIQMEV
jgi:hypothetical protein